MAYKNKQDEVAAKRRNYLLNKQKYVDKSAKLREDLMDKINKIREKNPCADCGKHYPACVMDFDHLPEYKKVRSVVHLAMAGATKMLEEELPKCEVVCSNCHRLRTEKRRLASLIG